MLIIKLLAIMSMTNDCSFNPQDAFIGGVVGQEVIKAITGKFMPITQMFYNDSIEVVNQELFSADWLNAKKEEPIAADSEPKETETKEADADATPKETKIQEKKIFTLMDVSPHEFRVQAEKFGVIPDSVKNRSIGLQKLMGADLLKKVRQSELFMVGSGAIGCELLKNYAMLGVGAEGKIILTDPDVIEVSNLNRQFLFREKHVRKAKSLTAAASAQQMNPELKGHLIARLDKVHEGTSHIFTDKFFESLTVTTNALDNIQARRYVDLRCIRSQIPLIESGTLGPKGHVQVILPWKTESYGSQKDPDNETQIPHCTLKMFPEETLHCVEWARDKFSKIFSDRPKALAKCLDDQKTGKINAGELKALKEAGTYAAKAPKDFDDCLKYGRSKFEKYFNHDVKQLLYAYPLDHMTKEGNPFWSLPKRPPVPAIFDPKNEVHYELVIAFACLRAQIYGITKPAEVREQATKDKLIAWVFKEIKCKEWTIDEDKAKAMQAEVEKGDAEKGETPKEDEATKPKEEIMTEGGEQKMSENPTPDNAPTKKTPEIDTLSFEYMHAKFVENIGTLTPENVKPEEFEKDVDTNYHIDAIYSMANCRAACYALDHMDWMTVKIKAGKIIPA